MNNITEKYNGKDGLEGSIIHFKIVKYEIDLLQKTIFVKMFKSIISLLLFITICSKSFSQNDSITINQDPKLLKVMELKKIVNQEAFTSGQFTIQIFSGNYTDYKILMDELKADDKYDEIFYSFETPYYKIRLGKYVSRILAIKELKNIKKEFSSAFILQPK